MADRLDLETFFGLLCLAAWLLLLSPGVQIVRSAGSVPGAIPSASAAR